MSDIPDALRDMVVQRAAGRCEYCRLAQAGQEAEFHVDHVHPRAAGGPTIADNLALACVSCSLRKGARQTAVDQETGAVVPLFQPRIMQWPEHFRWDGERVIGLTPTGSDPGEITARFRDPGGNVIGLYQEPGRGADSKTT